MEVVVKEAKQPYEMGDVGCRGLPCEYFKEWWEYHGCECEMCTGCIEKVAGTCRLSKLCILDTKFFMSERGWK